MNPEQIILNISVNLHRLSRFAIEKREKRIQQFIEETKEYMQLLETHTLPNSFKKTFTKFSETFAVLASASEYDNEWAESMATWANILQHRTKLLT